MFEPWAAELIARANLKPGCSVLDVASGLGPVSRLAAEAAGPGGRVVASEISAATMVVARVGMQSRRNTVCASRRKRENAGSQAWLD
jgi:ubiquinone/menaquinone biosynthesis C-methylase UbiE